MVYYRRYVRRRFVRRRGRYNNRKRLGTRIKRQVSRMQETKEYSRQLNLSVSDAGSVSPCFQVAQGTGSSDRIGQYVTLKNMNFQFEVIAADATNEIRIVFFQWLALNTPAVNDILYILPPFNTHIFLAPFSKLNTPVYKILYNKYFTVDSDDPAKVVRGYINMKKVTKRLFFQDSLATSTAYNQIYALVISDSTATVHPGVFGTVTTHYKDS